MLDLLFKGATVVDGTGAPAYRGDVGVKDGRMVLPAAGEAATVVDAEGLTLCPGFIDAHSHGDLVMATYEGLLPKVSQGITTEVAGQCGVTAFPIRQERAASMGGLWAPMIARHGGDLSVFYSAETLRSWADTAPMACDMFIMAGHCNLRIAAMGFDNRKPTPAEMDTMKNLLREAMENGALGLSSGLIYTPGAFADTEELIELCRVIAPYGGIYATHMRNESDGLIGSVKESIAVAEAAGVPLVISHHKACGRENWGQSAKTLALVHEAIGRGVRITLDQYPYTASMTGLNTCIPPWYLSGGNESLLSALRDPEARRTMRAEMLDPAAPFDNQYLSCGGFEGIFISQADHTPEAQGLFVSEWAERQGADAFEAFFDMLADNGGVPMGLFFAMCDEDVEAIYRDENTVVGTDGLYLVPGVKGHPRAFGSLPRTLRLFWREKGLVSLEQAVYKMTGLTAQRLGLRRKGVIKDGNDADFVLFDADAITDRATFADPNALCTGIRSVYVAGQLVFADGAPTEARPGRLIAYNNQI